MLIGTNLFMMLGKLKYFIVLILDWLYLKSYDFYIFGKNKFSNGKSYKELFNEINQKSYDAIEKLEIEMNHSIDKKWIDDLALITQIVKKKSELNYSHGKALYCVLSNYLQKKINQNLKENLTILETGTARGFSAICMSKALIDKKINGKIITIDVISHNKEIYWNCIKDETGPKKRSELLENWKHELENIIFLQGRSSVVLKMIGVNRINFAFLDGQHDEQTIVNEFNFVAEKQKKGDIIFFDDINKDKFSELYFFVENLSKKKEYFIKLIEVNQNRTYAIAEKN